jgi:hypothetical protein
MPEEHLTFDGLGLIPELLSATKRAGYVRPTPIQQLAIPPALAGRDVLGCAQTGTGKTATFALPILQHLNALVGNKPRIRALVLTPTRELAAQISESVTTYGKDLDLWHTVIFGGVSDKPQIAELRRGVDLLVATPGRLLDLMGRGLVQLDDVELSARRPSHHQGASEGSSDHVLLGHDAVADSAPRRGAPRPSRERGGGAGVLDGRPDRAKGLFRKEVRQA